jgi:zinc transporter
VSVDALLAQGSRPSFVLADDGVLLNLRGVNMNTGAVPADMEPIRI